MRATIQNFLNQYDFDVRKSGDCRFVDQKCTPDIVCFIADCVINLIATKPTFTITYLWNTQYFIQNTRVIFNKPWANDEKAKNEYNKVLCQPLKALAYAKILNVEKVGNTLTFSVNNEELLEWIARRDRNAYVFLYEFYTKVLRDSGFMKYLEGYKTGTMTKREVYDRYIRFVRGNTPTHSELDIKRMFHKVFNIYAAEHGLIGSSGKSPRLYSDLMYNRVNWRDIDKDKTQTRQEAENIEEKERREVLNNYYVQKAIALIRKIQHVSEVHDKWGQDTATQVHHIFPKSKFPQIAHYIENLILLTATQHFTKAHPNNNTQEIDPDYQLVCLLAKADTINKSLRAIGEKYYRKESFVYVINTGLETDVKTSLSFSEIKEFLIHHYNGRA